MSDAAAVAFVESVTVVADALAQAKHFHRPDLTRPLGETYIQGVRHQTYPCSVDGCDETLERRPPKDATVDAGIF